MQCKRWLGSIAGGVLLSALLLSTTPSQPSLLKKRALADLDTIRNIFEVKYAPTLWKKEFAAWELDPAIEEAKDTIRSFSPLTLKQCQVAIRNFFNSTEDYHVGVKFYSTECASLPFMIKEAEGRFFISYVDRSQVSERGFPFFIGDEILNFDNLPIGEAVDTLQREEYGSNTWETNRALATHALTYRRGDLGQIIPQGECHISGIRQGEQKVRYATVDWSYAPEKIKDFAKLGTLEAAYSPSALEWHENPLQALKNSSFFQKMMVSHFWDRSYVGGSLEGNPHTLGAKKDFLPNLGQVIWRNNSYWIFDAYIFLTPSNERVGYIRLPHYLGDEEEVEEFGILMNYFQQNTDALVLDQMNNPGGSIFYLYGLASTLTNRPLFAPKHHITLTQEEVSTAITLLSYLDQVCDTYSAKEVLGDNIGGYMIDYKFAQLMRDFCHFLIKQWNEGRLYTELTHLYGVDHILPHPEYRYTKPILLLVNELCFSGGDFFPAVLQDSNRAKVMGTRTSGAGGYVANVQFPNHTGMQSFSLTGSLAERRDSTPLENLGVVPDIPYTLTTEDLENHYSEFADAIVQEVQTLLSQKKG
ncbi:MAG: hypothetical protein K940chlam9_00727 [Chlamydiae bacterium]|nr:hypothetical protein [Chlamydiota bacterium]